MTDLMEQTFDKDHHPSPYCLCTTCKHLRNTQNCSNPSNCITLAKDVMLCLPPKWLPSENHDQPHQLQGDLDLENRMDDNIHLFKPKLRVMTYLEDAFHIVKPKINCHPNPARCHAPNRFGTVNMEDNVNIKRS